MRLVLTHPADADLIATCGLNHTRIGWWCEVRRAGRLLESYDGLAVAGGESTLAGVIAVLVKHGFLAQEDVADAHRLLPVVDCLDDIEDEGVRRAAAVIERLKRSAAAG